MLQEVEPKSKRFYIDVSSLIVVLEIANHTTLETMQNLICVSTAIKEQAVASLLIALS
jgi:hypothetical protein